MSVCSSGSPPLAFIWFRLYVIHLANKSSSSSFSSCMPLKDAVCRKKIYSLLILLLIDFFYEIALNE